MKRIKYMNSLKLSRQQKNTPSSSAKQDQSATLKDFYSLQQFALSKTPLNLTTYHPERESYRSRSQYRSMESRRSPSTSYKSYNSLRRDEHKIKQSKEINIRNLLKVKSKTQQFENEKLRNPFYKIQKSRLMQKNYSLLNNNEPSKFQSNSQIENSLQLKLKTQQAQSEQYFISRQKKQWYFASKNYRFRTLQNDQKYPVKQVSGSKERMMRALILSNPIKKQGAQIGSRAKQNKQDKINLAAQPKYQAAQNQQSNDQNYKNMNQFIDGSILQFKSSQNILIHDNLDKFQSQIGVIMQESRQESPIKIRQKSLTVKYNEIKDYFEKKYMKNDLLIENFNDEMKFID